jgi:hypothetical protein
MAAVGEREKFCMREAGAAINIPLSGGFLYSAIIFPALQSWAEDDTIKKKETSI